MFSLRWDLNPRPKVYETFALAELSYRGSIKYHMEFIFPDI